MEIDQAFLSELERIFKEEFLKAAPLYKASSKVKLPYEDLHRPTLMYRGSLKEVTRQVDVIADFEILKTYPEPEVNEIIETVTKLVQQAGHLVDGLIRMENYRSGVNDYRDVRNLKVIDIFEHADGRRNLQVVFVNQPPTVDQATPNTVWFAYKFYFAAAAIVMEYKKPA